MLFGIVVTAMTGLLGSNPDEARGTQRVIFWVFTNDMLKLCYSYERNHKI